MFTECPECSTAFRVTAKVLQQAGGRVRCGGCGHAFSAIEHLTEEVPGSNEQDSTPPSEAADDLTSDDKFAETSRLLLKTLDELAGPQDVRIEDTGFEWQVLDDDEDEGIAAEAAPTEVAPTKDVAAGAAPTESDEEQAEPALSEQEDWTGLLEEVAEDDTGADAISLEVEEELAAIHNELSTKQDPAPVDLNSQFDMQAEAMGLEITGTHDIEDVDEDDLTDAVALTEDDEGIAAEAAPADAVPTDDEEEGIAAEEAAPADAVPTDDEEEGIAAEAAPTKDVAAGRSRPSMGSATYVHPVQNAAPAEPAPAEEATKLSLEGADGAAPVKPEYSVADEVPEPSEEEMTINQQIDQELLAAADEDIDLKATLVGLEVPGGLFDEDSPEVESIVMEGETVRGSFDEEEPRRPRHEALDRFDNAGNLVDSYIANRAMRGGRRRTDPASYGVIAGTILLSLLLVGQVVHANRESLATAGLFNQTIGSVYRMFGNPIMPEWDIKGWQFEATNGSIAEDEDVLTILSRIGNRSQQPLPYPLVHVSLTDRQEEIIGSRILEPNEYLAGDLDPSKPVTPGENFTAVITIDEPSVDATGFKLNVCYRVSPGRVRCAADDFKN